MRVLLAGVSVRALAASAARAGHDVACLDYFGDMDLPAEAPARSILRETREGYDARSLSRLASGLEYNALAYVANLENHPGVVRELAGDRPVLGNSPEILEKVRHWPTLRRACSKEGLAMPPTLFKGEERQAHPGLSWLRKPVAGGGGHSIRPWDGTPLDHGHYLQARQEGAPASAVFVANGFDCRVLGISEQLIGMAGLGARDFRYCGNVFPLAPEMGCRRELQERVQDMARKLTRRFGLRGVNGLDFVVAAGPDGEPGPVLLEVNPRPTASAELVEDALGESIFDLHADPLAGWRNGPDLVLPREYLAKGIVFTRAPATMPDTTAWPGLGRRDVPRTGERIPTRRPVCTVYARGRDRASCLDNLARAADQVRRDIGDLEEH